MHQFKDSKITLKRAKKDYLLQPVTAIATLGLTEKERKLDHKNWKLPATDWRNCKWEDLNIATKRGRK